MLTTSLAQTVALKRTSLVQTVPHFVSQWRECILATGKGEWSVWKLIATPPPPVLHAFLDLTLRQAALSACQDGCCLATVPNAHPVTIYHQTALHVYQATHLHQTANKDVSWRQQVRATHHMHTLCLFPISQLFMKLLKTACPQLRLALVHPLTV